jgi:hypothetical protein
MRTPIKLDRPSGPAAGTTARERELEEAVLALRGLVDVRMLLESRGASTAEVRAHAGEIDRLRAQIVRLVMESAEAA